MRNKDTAFISFENYRLFTKYITLFPDNTNSPTLVFLHDSWGCTAMWEDFPDKLCRISKLNGLVYDRQGYGQSSSFNISERTNDYLHNEADVLIQLLDKLNIEQAILYGHSDGASIALIAAAKYPARIKGLLLEGPHSFVEKSGKNAVRASRERAKHSNLLKKLELFHGNKTSELFRLWHETWLNPDFSIWNIADILKNIQCPVLAFQGDSDEFGTYEQLDILNKNISSQVTIAEIPFAGHTPRKENPDTTMKLIFNFFSELLQQ